jgi:hypothetical protein
MTFRAAIAAVGLALLPSMATADRGAVTLELGPALTLTRAPPSQGSGSTILATGGGGAIAIRYALSNELELAATALWERPVDYFHSGVDLGTKTGSVRGTLADRAQRYGGLAGVRYVRGYVWRLHLGAEVGWSHETFTRRDLLDVSDPGNVHSFGLGLQDRTTDSLVLAPVAGIEWQLADHWSITALTRLQLPIRGATGIGLVVPVTVGYSWYVF